MNLGSSPGAGRAFTLALLFVSVSLARCSELKRPSDQLEPSAGTSNAGEAGSGRAGAAGASAGEAAGGAPSADGGDAGDGDPGMAGDSVGGTPSAGGTGEPEAGTTAGGQSNTGGRTTTAGSGGKLGSGGTAGRGQSGAGAGGSGGVAPQPPPGPDFILGADVSSVHEALDQGATFVDTDGVSRPFAEILKGHGFNWARLRTFVDPHNLYGYANPNGESEFVKPKPYCDGAQTAEFGKTLKDAGLKLLVDLHYSDNWADPSKQIIPERWRGAASIDELGENVKTYTSELVQALIDGGARPDIIQVGNEITPGMLIHVPAASPNPDQWGNMDKIVNPVNGASSSANWPNLGVLLKKGIEGVKAVDPAIKIMLHIENTKSASAVTSWVNAARAQGVEFDILGLSCYTSWHGTPSTWEYTFQTVAKAFPDLSFVIAEYNPEPRRANEIMRDLPGRRGLGTFFWEPTQSGSWGSALFSRIGDTYHADPTRFAEYDSIRDDFEMN